MTQVTLGKDPSLHTAIYIDHIYSVCPPPPWDITSIKTIHHKSFAIRTTIPAVEDKSTPLKRTYQIVVIVEKTLVQNGRERIRPVPDQLLIHIHSITHHE